MREKAIIKQTAYRLPKTLMFLKPSKIFFKGKLTRKQIKDASKLKTAKKCKKNIIICSLV